MDREMMMEHALAKAVSLLRRGPGRGAGKLREEIDNVSSLAELLGVDAGDECCYTGRLQIAEGPRLRAMAGMLDIVSGRITLDTAQGLPPPPTARIEFSVHMTGRFWPMQVAFADKPTGLELYAADGLAELRAHLAGLPAPVRTEAPEAADCPTSFGGVGQLELLAGVANPAPALC